MHDDYWEKYDLLIMKYMYNVILFFKIGNPRDLQCLRVKTNLE